MARSAVASASAWREGLGRASHHSRGKVTAMAEGRDAGGEAAAMRAARMEAQARRAAPPREVRLVAHSNMLYWWVVWLYGYICALATYVNHVAMPFAGKQIKFFPEAWL